SNTITLVAGTTYTLTAVNNQTDGNSGLPVIAANDELTIIGNGDVIERSTATGTAAFRLFDVAGGAALELHDLTLRGGLALGNGVSARGGGILNQGTATLVGVTVSGNTARGADGGFVWSYAMPGGDAEGGGLNSSGVLTLQGCLLQGNTAVGGQGVD